jgi:predicted signal transduction protein with EAL and GGDEF domain
VNLFSNSAAFNGRFGSDFNNIAWPTAIFFMSLSVWLPTRHHDPLRPQKTSGFFLPGLAASASLFILIYGANTNLSSEALWLAVATLLTVGVRLLLSARSLRILTEERNRQAHTDELTGLGNRRQLAMVLDLFFADQANDDASLR